MIHGTKSGGHWVRVLSARDCALLVTHRANVNTQPDVSLACHDKHPHF